MGLASLTFFKLNFMTILPFCSFGVPFKDAPERLKKLIIKILLRLLFKYFLHFRIQLFQVKEPALAVSKVTLVILPVTVVLAIALL